MREFWRILEMVVRSRRESRWHRFRNVLIGNPRLSHTRRVLLVLGQSVTAGIQGGGGAVA
jgi:hypothetical protein